MSDHIQAIKAFHACRNFGTRDNLLNAQQEIAVAYRSLSVEECQTLIEFAIKNREKDILSHLACLQPGSLAKHHPDLVNMGLIYPPEILHRADEQTAAALIQQLEDGSAENVNMSLLALAWADHPAVVDAFRRWRSTTPSWSESLHVSPDEYADSAGWELTEDGQRRGLILEKCFPLVSPDHPDALPGIVGINLPSDSSCHWCGRRLTAVFDFDLTSEILAFLGISGTRLRIETCDVCTCYGFIFTNVDWNGASSWHPANERPAYLPGDTDDWPFPKEEALRLSRHQRSIMESANRNMPISFSQIGGHPSWEQDAEYTRCPSCQMRMVFIGQLSNEDYESAEGIYYAFLCRNCQVAATHYQQT